MNCIFMYHLVEMHKMFDACNICQVVSMNKCTGLQYDAFGLFLLYLSTHTHTHTHTHTNTDTHTHMYMYVCMYVCMYVHMYVCMYVYTRHFACYLDPLPLLFVICNRL